MPLSRGFTLFEKNRGRSVNIKKKIAGPVGLLGEWAELCRWIELDWALDWAEIRAGLDRTGLGSDLGRIGLDWAELDWVLIWAELGRIGLTGSPTCRGCTG
ncbi:hypothetical protein CRG98_049347 [Punica granatum]|uniref:Uncharacterized protein n=1 Tax=Punica granatum TaxID=22663 RepID=A0A2I0HF11_PUNGR|nr:hypothetical protein CRG98_049347 [Punica granatum]